MTHYDDPSGLLSGNVSSAYDQARLIAYAVGRRAHRRRSCASRNTTSRPANAVVHVNSTNRLVRTGELDVLGGKTGFISSSGYCLATLVRAAADRPAGGGRGAGRAVERRPLRRDQAPVQLAERPPHHHGVDRGRVAAEPAVASSCNGGRPRRYSRLVALCGHRLIQRQRRHRVERQEEAAARRGLTSSAFR